MNLSIVSIKSDIQMRWDDQIELRWSNQCSKISENCKRNHKGKESVLVVSLWSSPDTHHVASYWKRRNWVTGDRDNMVLMHPQW